VRVLRGTTGNSGSIRSRSSSGTSCRGDRPLLTTGVTRAGRRHVDHWQDL
jgi:hypothetical protein